MNRATLALAGLLSCLPCCAEVPEEPLPGASLYHLDGTWTDQTGQPFRLADARGEPVVLALFYGSCDGACPRLLHDVQHLDDALYTDSRRHVRVVAVSIDPARDTPASLASHATAMGWQDWTFLVGSADQVRTLAAAVGFQYRDLGDGTFSHTNAYWVLDRDGVIARRIEGLAQPVEEPAAELRRLVEG